MPKTRNKGQKMGKLQHFGSDKGPDEILQTKPVGISSLSNKIQIEHESFRKFNNRKTSEQLSAQSSEEKLNMKATRSKLPIAEPSHNKIQVNKETKSVVKQEVQGAIHPVNKPIKNSFKVK